MGAHCEEIREESEMANLVFFSKMASILPWVPVDNFSLSIPERASGARVLLYWKTRRILHDAYNFSGDTVDH